MAVDERDGLWKTRGEGLTVSTPITKEVCEICGIVFEIPMHFRDYRGGVCYEIADAYFQLTYRDVSDPKFSQVCQDCFDKIKAAVDSVIETLKRVEEDKESGLA